MRHIYLERANHDLSSGVDNQGRKPGVIPKAPSFMSLCSVLLAGPLKPTRTWPLARDTRTLGPCLESGFLRTLGCSQPWEEGGVLRGDGTTEEGRPGLWRRLMWLWEARGGHGVWLGK